MSESLLAIFVGLMTVVGLFAVACVLVAVAGGILNIDESKSPPLAAMAALGTGIISLTVISVATVLIAGGLFLVGDAVLGWLGW